MSADAEGQLAHAGSGRPVTLLRELALPAELDRVEGLYRETRIEAPPPGRFAWAYLANPAGVARVWGAEADGRLVGMAAVFPRRLRLAAGQDVVAWTTGDLSVDPVYRRQGIAQALREETRRAVNRGDAACLLTMPNEAASRVHDRVGFTHLGHMQRLVRPVSAPGPRWARALTRTIVDLALRPTGGTRLATHLLAASEDEAPTLAQVETLYDRMSHTLGTSLVRSAAYVEWRYLRNPRAAARLLLAFEGSRLRGYVAVVARNRSLYFRDWLADEPGVLQGLVAEATTLAAAEGRTWLSASALKGHRDLSVLQAAGFLARGAGTAVKVYAPATEAWAGVVLSPHAWYLTGGDPDI